MAAGVVGMATGQHQRDGEFVIDAQQVVGGIAEHAAADAADLDFRLGHYLGMQLAQESIDFQIAVIAIRGIADHLVGADQAVEPVRIHGRRRHALGFVDDQAGEIAVLLIQIA
jgi:hypothetical protein